MIKNCKIKCLCDKNCACLERNKIYDVDDNGNIFDEDGDAYFVGYDTIEELNSESYHSWELVEDLTDDPIEEVTMYKTDGLMFETKEEAKKYIESYKVINCAKALNNFIKSRCEYELNHETAIFNGLKTEDVKDIIDIIKKIK